MAENEIELDAAPAKPKPKAQVSAWMLVLSVIAFLCFVGVLSLQTIEFLYMRGNLAQDGVPFSAEVILPPSP